jgi:hypothetical protein
MDNGIFNGHDGRFKRIGPDQNAPVTGIAQP